MLDRLQFTLNRFANHKFFMGIIMILLNIGAKYIEIGLSKTQEQALRNGLGREILIFAVVFMGTHDLVISILMTAAFLILSDHLLNENSKYCVIPNYLNKVAAKIDINNDGKISPDEEKRALEILQKADAQRDQQQQKKFTNFFQNYS
tara:strand:+ start:330 stop:773 length:444 start_codon:yes stop_codon:yes gene_type:complete